MKIEYTGTFLHQVKKIRDRSVKDMIDSAVLSVKKAAGTRNIPGLIKMEGYKIHYRIRIGRYRIGVKIEGNLVTFEKFGLRKDFYKTFP